MPIAKKSTPGERGKKTEKKVQDYLESLNGAYAAFDYERLPDARAAGGRLKAMAADFEFFAPGVHGLIEAKETEHEFRLHRDKVTQMPRLRKRALAGGHCLLVVFHSTTAKWRCIPIDDLPRIEKGSWDLTPWPAYGSLPEAMPASLLVVPQ